MKRGRRMDLANMANPPAMALLFGVEPVEAVLTGAGGVSPVEMVLGIERLRDDSKSIVYAAMMGGVRRRGVGRPCIICYGRVEVVNFNGRGKIRRS